MKNISLLLLLLSCFFAYGQVKSIVQPVLESFSDLPNIRDFTISSTGQEGYISAQSLLGEISVLVRISKSNGQWIPQSILPFSGKYNDLEPFLSHDNLKLYFVSNRPKTDSTNVPGDYDIWYVKRENVNEEWGAPINIGAPVNTSYNEFYPSVSQNNNLYFTSDTPGSKGKDDIFCSVWENKEYSEPFSLSDSINTEGYEFNAFISYDESYLIFSGYDREDGNGSGDLYISFRDNNDIWGKAINLGSDINSEYMDYCPFVDHESMTLYFTSRRSSFQEVNNFQSLEELINEINMYENGMSRIYKVDFKNVLFYKNH